MQAPRPRTPSLLDSPTSTSTSARVSLSFYCSNWMIIKFLNRILLIDNPKYVWRKISLDLTKDLYTQQKERPKTWLGFSLLYLGQNIKPYTSYGLRAESENSAEKRSTRISIGWVWFSIDQAKPNCTMNSAAARFQLYIKCIHFEQV